MADLEQILNIVIPVGVIIIFLGFIYWKAKDPIDNIAKIIWRGISKLLDSIVSSLSGGTSTEVIYK